MEPVNQPARLAGEASAAKCAPPIVVCLDDDPLVGEIFRAAAARAGVQGVFLTDAGEFERAIKALAPVAVVLDQVMPDRSGAELILWMRGLADPPGVIVIGADPLYVDSAAALVKGAGLCFVAALRKPLPVAEFAATIQFAVGAKTRRDPER